MENLSTIKTLIHINVDGFFFLFALNCKVVYNEKMTQLSPLVLHYLLWDEEGVIMNIYIYMYIYACNVEDLTWDLDRTWA